MNFVARTLIMLLLNLGVVALAQVKEMTRNDFASKLVEIKKGMVRLDVERFLGKPEKVIFTDASPAEIWYYGTNNVSDLPTLGYVWFDESGIVISAFGSMGTPANLDRITEDKLRDCLRLIHSMPAIDGYNWDPALVIKIANALTDLGKEDGLAVLHEYVTVAPLDIEVIERVWLLLRVLHQVPQDTKHFPEWEPGDFGELKLIPKEQVPRFPLHFVREIPVLFVTRLEYAIYVEPHSTLQMLEWYRDHGVWRESKLELPSLSSEELEAMRSELMDLTGQYMSDKMARRTTAMVCSQLERLKSRPQNKDRSKD